MAEKRLKLTIAKVYDPKDIGKDKPLLKYMFDAKGEDADKEFQYFTFSQQLSEYIKKAAVIDCDISVSSREVKGNTYIDHKVTQIYVDGKPVATQRQGYQRKSSPDERASIESQVAFKGIIELMASKVISLSHDTAVKALWWADTRLTNQPAQKASQTASEPSEAAETEPQDLSTLSPSNLGELFTLSLKHLNLNQSQVLEKLELPDKSQIADVGEAWAKLVSEKGD